MRTTGRKQAFKNAHGGNVRATMLHLHANGCDYHVLVVEGGCDLQLFDRTSPSVVVVVDSVRGMASGVFDRRAPSVAYVAQRLCVGTLDAEVLIDVVNAFFPQED